MQQKYIYKKLLYASNGIDEKEYSDLVYEKLNKLENYYELKKQNCDEKVIFKVLDISRATLFRWKSRYEKHGLSGLENENKAPENRPRKKIRPEVEKLILQIRKANPIWGKKKIKVILERDYKINVSVTSVGRVITRLINSNKVRPSYFYFGRLREKKKRVFNNHAKKWKYGMKAKLPGELLQIDHTVIEVEPGKYVKQFDATCPITKFTISQVFARATSKTASVFLAYVQGMSPFKIKSIQVDGGSEFMGNFEDYCKENNLELYVLPPRSPEFNGNVERRHGTIKYEFYSTYDGSSNLAEIRPKLAKFMEKYNKYRPHESLGFETPWDFFLKLEI